MINLQYWEEEISKCDTLKKLEELRIHLLGKSSLTATLLKNLSHIPPEERREKGKEINHIKETLTAFISTQKKQIEEENIQQRLIHETIDVTLSPRPEQQGTLHPISRVIAEVSRYFTSYGFRVESGPDIEDEDHNFNDLNIPAHHPARQSHDTFYLPPLRGVTRLLRTHTSPVQIRVMKKNPPPLRILAPGRVYRCDHDATHTPLFHQIEGLVVDKNIHMGHLKGCLSDFCRSFFGVETLPIRFRPSFFPFTEPSAEIDIGWDRRQGTIGQGSDWLEILGCGMVHPQVLINCGVDPEVYQGFAFGMGVERMAMLKYGMTDIRPFYDSDIRWLNHSHFPSFS